jgi:hypothetical protein
MKQDENRRIKKDRRESTDKRSEKFMKYFIPEEEETRKDEDDRRKTDSDND